MRKLSRISAAILCLALLFSSTATGGETKNVRVLVFDGLADWEIGLVTYELNTRNKILVETVGFTTDPATTGGGLTVLPDITLVDVVPAETAMLILPGGEMWHELESPELVRLLGELRAAGIPVAGICSATTFLARAGLSEPDIKHTSNALPYLKDVVPDYTGEANYVDAYAVSDRGVITAAGGAPFEFAYEILKELGVYDDEVLAEFAEFWDCRDR